MVIVFATVVFAGSVIKGVRDHVGGLFANSTRTCQETSKSGTVTEHLETIKTKPNKRNPQHHPPNHPKKAATTQTRCFQSYSSKDFFSCREEILTPKDGGDLDRENTEDKESKQVRSTNPTPAASKQDHATCTNESSQFPCERPKSGLTEDDTPVNISSRNNEKPKCVWFERNDFPSRNQIRPRRKRPKTLKKELEEAGLVIDESGQARIPADSHGECSTPTKWDEVDNENPIRNLNQGELGNPSNLHTSLDNLSTPENRRTRNKYDEGEWPDNAIIPAIVNENKAGNKSVAANNIDNQRPGKEAEKVQTPKASICYHCKRQINAGNLAGSEQESHSLVYAGDTIQNTNENQNHESGDIISETGDFGKPTEENAVKVSAASVNLIDMARVKHRSQKGMEDSALLHRHNRWDDCVTLQESFNLKSDPANVTNNCQQSAQNSKHDPKSFEVPEQQIQVHVVQATVNGTGDVVNDTSSVIPITNNHSNKPEFRGIPLRSTVYTNALDQVVVRFLDDGYEEDDTTAVVKKRQPKFLEDFSACDRVRAHWTRDFHLAHGTGQLQNNERDRQRRRWAKQKLGAMIFQGTFELADIAKKTEDLTAKIPMLSLEKEKAKSRMNMTEELVRRQECSLCRWCPRPGSKLEKAVKAVESRHRAIEDELNALKRREWKTGVMQRAAQGEVMLLDHRIAKEQSLQEEQREKRLRGKRRRFQRTSIKVNTLLTLIILQIIFVIIIALWRI